MSLTLKGIDSGTERKVNLPADARISMPEWSPDGTQFAFTNAAANTVELWAGNVGTGEVRRLAQGVNTTYGDPVRWMPDSRGLLVLTVPAGRGKPPEDGGAPWPELAPDDAPASLIVVATAMTFLPRGLAPLVVGLVLDRVLAAGATPLAAYHGLFVAAAVVQALVYLPLRSFGRSAPG